MGKILVFCFLWLFALVAQITRAEPIGNPSIASFAPGKVIHPDKFNRVHLQNIRTIHLSSEGSAVTRRMPKAPPQLECVGGKAWFDSYRLGRAVCLQDGGNWTCNAETAPGYVVRDVRVVCEGYDGPQDEYVVDGSCTMQYMLDHASEDIAEEVGAFGVKFFAGTIGIFGIAVSSVLFISFIAFRIVKRIRRNPYEFKPNLRKAKQEDEDVDQLLDSLDRV